MIIRIRAAYILAKQQGIMWAEEKPVKVVLKMGVPVVMGMLFMVALAGIVGNGGSSYIARCIGAGDMDEANHTLTIGFEMIAGTVANIILDPIFIFTLRLEIKVAAIKWIKPNKLIVGENMWVGIPHTLEQFLATAAIIVINNLAASYGELTVAAMGVSSKIMSFGTYINCRIYSNARGHCNWHKGAACSDADATVCCDNQHCTKLF